MPKMKTFSGAKKRIKVTGSGKLRRRKAFRGHIMEKKSSTRARRLGRETDIAPGQLKHVKKHVGSLGRTSRKRKCHGTSKKGG
jgi:large subunit ribosomal protein L35